MKQQTILFFFFLFGISAWAQKEKSIAYIEKYKELAMAEMLRSGVPASITLAQGILESQSGESDLAKKSNNHFGIKCKTEWTGAKTYHDDDERGECFRVYPTVEESYKDHSEFLKTRPHYAFLFQLDPTDYDSWAKGLKKAGYATSSTYPQRLMKVITDYGLQQYSLMAMEMKLMEGRKTGTDIAIGPAYKISYLQSSEPLPLQEAAIMPVNTEPIHYPTGIFTINQSKVIHAVAGTSLLLLATQYDIPLSKLLEYNELTELEVLDKDRLIYLERKLKKGANTVYIAKPGETLYDISQQEGVRLESILLYNTLQKGSRLQSGEKIYLQPINTTHKSVMASPK